MLFWWLHWQVNAVNKVCSDYAYNSRWTECNYKQCHQTKPKDWMAKRKTQCPTEYSCFEKLHKWNLEKSTTLENMLQTDHSFCCFIFSVLVIQDLICWLGQYWPGKVFISIVCPDLLLELHFCSWKTKQHFGLTSHSQNNLFSISSINAKIILFYRT